MDILDLIFTEQVLEVLLGAALELLAIGVTFIIGWAGLAAKKYIKDKDNALQLEQKEKYARVAVFGIERALQEFDGAEKFVGAKQALLDWTKANNIPLAEEELDLLIENAVTQMKDEGKEIKKAYNETKAEQVVLPLEEE